MSFPFSFVSTIVVIKADLKVYVKLINAKNANKYSYLTDVFGSNGHQSDVVYNYY